MENGISHKSEKAHFTFHISQNVKRVLRVGLPYTSVITEEMNESGYFVEQSSLQYIQTKTISYMHCNINIRESKKKNKNNNKRHGDKMVQMLNTVHRVRCKVYSAQYRIIEIH